MPVLCSNLFGGDLKLNNALNSDAGHITRGQRGDHVAKIQTALSTIDGLTIASSEVTGKLYGNSTAAAVVSYKQKRSIINRQYEKSVDDIVGKMTMASLDADMRRVEQRVIPTPKDPIQISNGRFRVKSHPSTPERKLALRPFAFTVKSKDVGAPSPQVSAPHFGPSERISVRVGEGGEFEVVGGIGQIVVNQNTDIVSVTDPDSNSHELRVTKDPHVFKFKSKIWGTARLVLVTPGSNTIPFGFAPPLIVDVQRQNGVVFKPTHAHHHKPCGKWNELVRNPGVSLSGSSMYLYVYCRTYHPSPEQLIQHAIDVEFSSLPIALHHLNWYLKSGGIDYNDDANLTDALYNDRGLRKNIRNDIQAYAPDGATRFKHDFTMGSNAFAVREYQYSWGTLDFLCYDADFVTRKITVWFKDCYEWHPVYRGYYEEFDDDDGSRPTNILHAALVEMKLKGAADFWMSGVATVPLDEIMFDSDY